MNRRDQELLDKQFNALSVPRRSDGVLMLGILAVFFAGVTLGGFLYAYTSEPGPVQLASNVPIALQQ
ncbi:MAG: hypothetical protein WBD71_02790 [Xanthobacteraceae bacterium]